MLQFHAAYCCDDDCTAVSLVNESCLPEWKIDRISHVRTYGLYNVHRRAETRQQCQNACLFNRGCVAVYWQRRNYCYMYTHLYGRGITTTGRYFVYKLVERCNITSGLLFLFISGSIACSGISITQGVMLMFFSAGATRWTDGGDIWRGVHQEVEVVNSSTPNFTPLVHRWGRGAPKTENCTQFRNINASQWRISLAIITKFSTFVRSFKLS